MAEGPDVRPPPPSRVTALPRRRRRKAGDAIDPFRGLVNAATSRPAEPAGKRILAAAVDRPIVTTGQERTARGENVLPLASRDAELKHGAIIQAVAEKGGLQFIPKTKTKLRGRGIYLERRRDDLINASLYWGG